MVRPHVRFGTAAMIGVFGLALASVSCSTVSPDDLDSELAAVRQEMQQADNQLSGRIDGMESRMSSLENELRSLRNDFNATVERMGGMLKFNVPVHFAFDDATVRELDKPVLDRFAAVVKEYYADALITVEGFADPAGSEAYNQGLGMRRANSVKQYLTTAAGLAPDMVKTVSYGEAANRQVVPGARGPGVTGIENRRAALVVDFEGSVRGQ